MRAAYYSTSQIYISYTLHVAPSEENERDETHRLRASPAFQGRPVFNDAAVMQPAGEEPWIGKILMLFRIKVKRRAVKVLQGKGRPETDVYYSLALMRWYQRLPRAVDAARCPVYRWETRAKQPQVSVIDIRTITEIVHMLPVPAPEVFGAELDLNYRNIWVRKELPY